MEHRKGRRQISQAREMLLGLPQWVPASRAFLYPAVDALLLVGRTQPEPEIAIVDKSSGAPRFATSSSLLSDGGDKEHFMLELPDAPDDAPNHPDRAVKVAPGSGRIGEGGIEDYDARGAIREVLREVRGKIGEEFRRSLHESLNEVESPPLISKRQVAARGEQIAEEASEWLRRTREVIDKATSQLTKCRAHQKKEQGQKSLSVHSIVYKRSSIGGKGRCKYSPILISERPKLGKNTEPARSSSDAFEHIRETTGSVNIPPSGNIQFVNNRTIAIPIHRSGFPWINMIKKFPYNKEIISKSRKFYESAIPRVSARVRSLLKESYLDYTASIFKKELKEDDVEDGIYNTNERYSELDKYCPFNEYRLSTKEDSLANGVHIGEYKNKELFVCEVEDERFNKNIRYGNIQDSEVKGRMKGVITEMKREDKKERQRANRFFKRRAEEQKHNFFNRNPMSRVYEAKRTVREVPKDNDHAKKVKRLLDEAYDLQVFRDVSLKIMLSDEDEDPQILEEELTSSTAYSMLEWLRDRVPSSEPVPDIVREDAKLQIPVGHKSDAFTALWCLWENSRNAYQKFRRKSGDGGSSVFRIDIKKVDGIPSLAFKNSGEIGKSNKRRLKKEDRVENIESGISIVKKCLRRIGWSIRSVETNGNSTRIIISKQNNA